LNNLANYIKLSPENAAPVSWQSMKVVNPSQGSGLLGLPGDYTSPSRFVKAAFFASFAEKPKTVEETVGLGFHILNTFDIFFGAVGSDYTQWTVVYDRTNLKFYVRSYESQQVESLDLKKIDFSKGEFKEIPLNKKFSIHAMNSGP
jgi:choloylglycine hydrolase